MQKWSQRISPKNKSKKVLQFAKTYWRGKMSFWPVITGDEAWIYHTTLKRSGKVHNGRLPIPHDQKYSVGPNQELKQCCGLFNIRGIVHYEFVPTGQSTKCTIWKYWKGCVKRRKRPEIFAINSCILHPDSPPAHTALSVRGFLATKQITVGTPCPFTGSSPSSFPRVVI